MFTTVPLERNKMPEVTQDMMACANFMETYVEPLFFFPVSVYLVNVEVAT